MNSIVLVFAAALAVAQAGILTHGVVGHSILAPSARTTHIQGPSASASIVGNDGSHIVAHAPGASITASEHAGGAAVAYSAPVLAHAAPAVVAHAAPAVAAYAAPAVTAYAAPAVVAHAAPAVATYAAPAVLAHGAPVWAHAHAHSIWA